MKIHIEQIKANNRFHGEKKSSLVDSGFVKTCDELVIGPIMTLKKMQRNI